VESYGHEQWPDVRCIDYWVHYDPAKPQCMLSVEGWNLPRLSIELQGNGRFDGAAIAATFARILGVPWPGV
jgi:hypothetical protein